MSTISGLVNDIDERSGNITGYIVPKGFGISVGYNGVTPDSNTPASPLSLSEYRELATKQLGGIKHDSAKPRMDLVPFEVVEEVAKVLGFGALKYGDWQWFSGFAYGRLYGAAMRHLTAFQQGQDLDEESGLSHVAHAICNLMFLQAQLIHKVGTDDRKKRGSNAPT